jgi:hypothetical protein
MLSDLLLIVDANESSGLKKTPERKKNSGKAKE